MNKRYAFIIALCLFGGNELSALQQTRKTLSFLDRNNIEQQAKKIDMLVNRHHAISLGITTVLLTSQLLQLAALYKLYTTDALLALHSDDLEQRVSAKLGMTEQIQLGFIYLKNQLYNLPGAIGNSITTGSFVQPMLHIMKEFGIYCGIQSVLDLFLTTVHHRDDLHWYIRHQAPVLQTISIMHEQISRLVDPENIVSDAQRQRCVDLVLSMAQELAHEQSDMIAFMVHKKRQLSVEAEEKVDIIIDFLFHYCNDWIATTNQFLLDNYDRPVIWIPALQVALTALKNEITLHGKQFATYEKQLRKRSLWNQLLH